MFALIMAGGRGKRFWPFSRFSMPKQFLKITGKDSMLIETVKRLDGLVPPENRVIVINKEHDNLVKDDIFKSSLILKEPFGRNTAPCVGLAALYLERIDPHMPVAVLPADHYIPDMEGFQKTLKKASLFAKEGHIVTIGIVPTRPETGYGYINRGEALYSGDVSAFKVNRFVEKPDIEKAMEYLATGEYFWNGGMFIFTPQVILEEISIHLPDFYKDLEILKKNMDGEDFNSVFEEVYEKINPVSIDYGIMEKTKRPLSVIPADFVWSDIGSWQSLFELKSSIADERGNVLDGAGVLINTKNSFICNKTDTFLTVLGMENLLAVSAEDAILITKLDESQRVQEIIEILKEKNLEEYL